MDVRAKATRSWIGLLASAGLVLAACGSDGDGAAGAPADDAPTELPTIVVTTNILGDVVDAVVGEFAEVVTIMPVGADPHDFQASAQEVDQMTSADALVVNGAGFEEGLLDVTESAADDGVPVFEAIGAVDTIELGDGDHDHAEGDEHPGNEHPDDRDEGADHDDHAEGHSGEDPHFFTDPVRMAEAVEGIVDFLQGSVEFADPEAVDASAADYVARLTALDEEMEAVFAPIPEADRVLVTNHEVFGYFADRYDFEVVGAVIPAGTTTDSASAGDLADLVATIEAERVPAIFADTSSSDDLIRTLADEVGDVSVVELFSESLGDAGSEGATYLDMVRTNGQRIRDALA